MIIPLAIDGGVGEYILASLIISAIATGASIGLSLLIRPKTGQLKGLPPNDITRGGYLSMVIGRRAIGLHVGWVGDRVSSKAGGGKGGSAPAGTNYAEGAWHQLTHGPIRQIRRIWAGNKTIWRVPIDFSTVADGSSYTLLNNVGVFRVYSGRDGQPGDAYLQGRTQIASAYPGLAYVSWQRCGLGNSTSWPQFKYEIESRPDDIADAFGLDLSWCPVDTWIGETTPGETLPTETRVWLNGKQPIAAGTYRITYRQGAFRLSPETGWFVHANHPNLPIPWGPGGSDTHIQVITSTGTMVVEAPGNSTSYATQEAAETANAGANVTFSWAGGIMGIRWSDISHFLGAVSGTPNPTYDIQLASGTGPIYSGPVMIEPGAAGSADMGANPAAAWFILMCAPFPYGCGISPDRIDLVALAAVATTLDTERLAVNVLIEDGKQAPDVIGSLMADIGMVVVEIDKKLKPYLIRPETTVPTIVADLTLDPPEENRQTGGFNGDRYTFQISDALHDYATGDVSLDDDAQALINNRPQAQSISLDNITSRVLAQQVGNRRWQELAAQAHKLPAFTALREVRDPRFHPGRTFIMNDLRLRVISWKPDTVGVAAELEAALDQYGDDTATTTPAGLPDAGNDPPGAPPEADQFFLPLIVPRVLWPSPTVPCFGVGRVRANHSVIGASVWLSDSSTGTFQRVGSQDPYSAGGTLVTAFTSSPGVLGTGPTFTPFNDDILEVPDLTGDTASYNAGLLLVACEEELMLLESVTAVGGGDYQLTNVTRGAFCTTVAAHAIGTPLVIIQQLQLVTIPSPLLATHQGGTLWVKTQPTDGVSVVDLSLVIPQSLNIPLNLLATITIAAPAGAVTIPIGVTYTIAWRTTQLTGNLKIEYSDDSGATWTTLAASVADTGFYAWDTTGLSATTTGEIRVSSVLTPCVFDFTYLFTLAAVTTPDAPTLSAIAGEQLVDLTWTAVADAIGYNLKRATVTGGPYTTIATIGVPAGVPGGVIPRTYIDGGLTNGTEYFYVISTLVAGAESADSAEVSATPFHCECGSGGTGSYTAFDTGEEFTGTLGDDARDDHWTVTLPEEAGGSTFDAYVPDNPWLGDHSYRISWQMSAASDSSISHPALYTFKISIHVTGDLDTLVVQCTYGADNSVADVIVNGTSSGLSGGFGTFTIPSDLLIDGDNDIEFVVQDDDGAGTIDLGVEWVH